jgi:hypothetical protein
MKTNTDTLLTQALIQYRSLRFQELIAKLNINYSDDDKKIHDFLTPLVQELDNEPCDLVTKMPENFSGVIRNQYIITRDGAWYFDYAKGTKKEVTFLEGIEPSSLFDALKLEKDRRATEADLKLIMSHTDPSHRTEKKGKFAQSKIDELQKEILKICMERPNNARKAAIAEFKTLMYRETLVEMYCQCIPLYQIHYKNELIENVRDALQENRDHQRFDFQNMPDLEYVLEENKINKHYYLKDYFEAQLEHLKNQIEDGNPTVCLDKKTPTPSYIKKFANLRNVFEYSNKAIENTLAALPPVQEASSKAASDMKDMKDALTAIKNHHKDVLVNDTRWNMFKFNKHETLKEVIDAFEQAEPEEKKAYLSKLYAGKGIAESTYEKLNKAQCLWTWITGDKTTTIKLLDKLAEEHKVEIEPQSSHP